MKFLSLFKREEKTGKDSTVDSSEIVQHGNDKPREEGQSVETILSFHPDWDVPKEQEYVFRFLTSELEPLKADQLSLSGISIDVQEGSGTWLVKVFLRSSVQESISIDTAELILSGEDDKIYARKEFNLNQLGVIPSNSARPWVFEFEKPYQLVEEPPTNDWALNFNVQSLVSHSLDIDSSWYDILSEKQIKELEEVVENLPELSKNELNLTGYQTHLNEDGSLNVVIFIRNSYNQTIDLETLPLEIVDASGEIVCKGDFNLPPLSVKGNTTKPWTFIFPKETILKEELDLSRWTARVTQ